MSPIILGFPIVLSELLYSKQIFNDFPLVFKIIKKIIQPTIFRALATLLCDRSTKKVIWIVLVKLCVCAACASVAVPHNN